jgi:predicted TPR repeat methyltransferase
MENAAMSFPPAADNFERAKTLFVDGLAALQAGQAALAGQHFTASLELLPGRISTLINLAATRILLEQPELALTAADEVLAMEPDNQEAWLHRATALGDLARHDEAADAFQRVLAAHAAQPEVWSRYAHSLLALHRDQEALQAYERALALAPAQGEVWSRYGELLREHHRLLEAATAFEQAIAHGADAELNGYYLAAVRHGGTGGAAMPPRPPDAYVRGLFDGYAADFDQHLVGRLGYQAHVVLTQHLSRLQRGPFHSALDLGCGTGLCGTLVRPHVAHLTGIDLSGPMLDKARALGVYDELVQADVTQFLQCSGRAYELILAADVFIYVGELTPVFAALRTVTRAGSVVCFTAEVPVDSTQELQLLPSLRYAHSEAYLRRLACDFGFDVLEVCQLPVRQDQRQPIDGLYVYLVRA